jgi:hypothetical protein
MDASLTGEAASHCRVISTKLLADVARTLRDNGEKYWAEKLEVLIGDRAFQLMAVSR